MREYASVSLSAPHPQSMLPSHSGPKTEYICFPGPPHRVPQTQWLKTQRYILLFLETRSPRSRCQKGTFLSFSSSFWSPPRSCLVVASCPSLPLSHVAPPLLHLTPSSAFLLQGHLTLDLAPTWIIQGFPHSSDGKESACNAGYQSSIPGLGRSPGVRNSNPLQYSCLRNPMDRGAWQATVHGATSWIIQGDLTSRALTQSHDL